MATIITDLLVQLSCAAAAVGLGGRPRIGHFGPGSSALTLMLIYVLLWAGAATAVGLYRADRRQRVVMMWVDRMKASLVVFAAIGAAVLVGFTGASLGASALWALALSALVGGLLGAWTEKLLRPSKFYRERALLVGTTESIARSAKRLDRHGSRIDVVGTLSLDASGAAEPGELGAGAGPECEIAERADALTASVVVMTTDAHVLGMHPMHVVWALETTGAVLMFDTGMHTLPNRRVALERVGGLVTVKARRRTTRSLGAVLSGLAQWCGAVLGLALLSPLLAALWIWIRLDSQGPALFIQERVGREGRIFPMYKFRTMVQGAHRIVHTVIVDPKEPNRGPLFKAREDSRITRAGRFLRKSSLDELPQLINVVRGEMRLVGPRPALPKEVAKYRGYEDRRLACKPGMTGLWQVSGRSDLDWARSVELDQTYVDGHSLGLDTFIVCRTPGAVASSRGAY